MSTNPIEAGAKIYNAPHAGDLQRIERPESVSFMTFFLEQKKDDTHPVSVGVELRLTNQSGDVVITMHRVANRPGGADCSTSAIRLPREAAADLVHSINTIELLAKPS